MDESIGRNGATLRDLVRREWPLLLLIVLLALIFLTRIASPPLRGEETRRAIVAITMQQTGDWAVPRQQGDPFFMGSRPPLQNWAIATVGWLRGVVDETAIRLPSILALFGTALVLYFYSRRYLSNVGALATSLGFATMFQVLELGRSGETDVLFTFWLSGALLCWHYADMRHWSPWIKWPAAYLLLTAATLTKGLQAPTYFAGTIGVWLLLERRWRELFAPAHLVAIVGALGLFSLWLLPATRSIGWMGVEHILTGDARLYGTDRSFSATVEHLGEFLPHLVFGCWAPWSWLLLNYLSPTFRARLGAAQPAVRFATIALVVSVPTVWFVTGTKPRFLLSVFPLAAVLIGAAVETLAALSQERRATLAGKTRPWQRCPLLPLGFFVSVVSWVCLATAAGVIVSSVLAWSTGQWWRFSLPPLGAVAWAVVAAGLGVTMWRTRRMQSPAVRVAGLSAVALFFGGAYTTLMVDDLTRRWPPMETEFVRVFANVPQGAELVSLGPVNHHFEYCYYRATGRFIPKLAEPTGPACPATPSGWFCTSSAACAADSTSPFPFRRVAEISNGRFQEPVILGFDPQFSAVQSMRTPVTPPESLER